MGSLAGSAEPFSAMPTNRQRTKEQKTTSNSEKDRLRRLSDIPKDHTVKRYLARVPIRSNVSGRIRTGRVSPELSVAKQERLVERQGRAPDLVVISPLQRLDLPQVGVRSSFGCVEPTWSR